MDKLERLKNIEKAIGIDPIVLLEGLTNPNSVIYIRHKGEIAEIPVCFADINSHDGRGILGRRAGKYFFDLKEGWYFLEDYGNTWAFTKGEMERCVDR